MAHKPQQPALVPPEVKVPAPKPAAGEHLPQPQQGERRT